MAEQIARKARNFQTLMDEPKPHPILPGPHEYAVSDFRFHLDRDDPSLSFIDMTLVKGSDAVTLRFWRPVELKIEAGFPRPTRGMVFYDRSAQGWEDIQVEVADIEASPGAITFFARSVERVGSSS